MAEVFLAESAGLEGFKKQVAIKRVLPHLSEKKRFIAMFLDEARLSAHLNHSNVAQVFDIGVGDASYFIVMEYVEGSDLKQLINHLRDAGRPFPIEVAVYISAKICEGLAYAHELTGPDGAPLSTVHRDMSPPNVLISKHGEVKIVDFGLAKASTQLEKSEAGIIKGKFSYLAPEAANGLEVDARADIFAVGIILWEMLAGRKLFHGNTDYETVKQVQAADVPSIAQLNPEASDPQLQSILARALARDRERRYGTARALGRDLTKLLYRLGKPVDAFDVAELIRGPMGERGRRQAGEGALLIDQLITETLLQFTSLKDKNQSTSGHSVSDSAISSPRQPLNIEDFAKWTGENVALDHHKAAQLVKNTLPANAFEEGNLAALEGPDEFRNLADLEEERSIEVVDDAGKEVLPRSVPSAYPRPSQAPAKTSMALRALLLVVIAAGTAAALHFSGIL